MAVCPRVSQTPFVVPSRLKPALMALLEARDYADDTHSDRWQFAVTLRELRRLGLRDNDVRWLVRKQFAEHAREVTLPGDDGRAFWPERNLIFGRRTCLALTDVGVISSRTLLETERISNQDVRPHLIHARSSKTLIPHWNPQLRELRFDGQVVKRFKWPAANQEIVLSAFEEDGWPVRIDDPLPPDSQQVSKCRLSDTIKCLNRKQMNRLVQFRGDGTGQGIIWESL